MRTLRLANGVTSKGMAVKLLSVLLIAVALVGLIVWKTAPHAHAAANARNLPANGQILFFMGQNSDTLSAYRSNVLNQTSNAPQPGGVTLYTNIVLGGSPAPLAGVNGPVNYGAGTMDWPTTLSQYPNAALAVGLYLSDQPGCANVPLRAIDGIINNQDVTQSTVTAYQSQVDTLINDLKNLNRPVFLRLGYEFDGPWNCYYYGYYTQAFRYIKGRIDALGATNVATVWQSAAYEQDSPGVYVCDINTPSCDYKNPCATKCVQPDLFSQEPAHLNLWYPGDDVVDWVGMSYFSGTQFPCPQWCDANNNPFHYDSTPRGIQNAILSFARGHSKPVMISESAPQGYNLGGAQPTVSGVLGYNAPQNVSASAIWTNWYQDYFNFITSNSDVIRAVAYINDNWNTEPIFQCTPSSCGNGGWGDSQIQDNALIESNFLSELQCNIFVNGTRNCGNTPPTATPGGNPTPTATPSSNPTPTNTPPANTPTPTATPTGGTIAVPGTVATNVGAVSNGQTLTYSISAATSGAYYVQVAATAAQQSSLLGFTVDGTAIGNAAFGPGSATVTPPDFKLSAGTHTLGVSVQSSGITIGSITVNARGGAPPLTPTPTNTPTGSGGGSANIPGTITTNVGPIANGTSKSWSINVTQAANYKFTITSTSSQNSQLITVAFNGSSLQQAIDSNATIPVYFNNVSVGSATLTITANSGSVSLGQIIGQTN